MLPTPYTRRQKDWIPFVNFAQVPLTPDTPEVVALQEHLFQALGADDLTPGNPAPEKLLWGVNGTGSIRTAGDQAVLHASQSGKQVLQIWTWYLIPGFEGVVRQDRAQAQRSGYVHMARITKEFRDSIHAMLIAWLTWVDPQAGVGFAKLPLDQLLVTRPDLVPWLFAECPWLDMLVHPVQAALGPSDVPIWVATCRNTPDRIMAAEVKFAPDVRVLLPTQ